MKMGRAGALLAASPALLSAAAVARLWLSGTLGYYVNATTVWVVLSGAVLFALVGIVSVVRAARWPGSTSALSWRTAVFLAPLLAALLLPARPLSAASGQSSSLGSLQLTTHVASGNGDLFGYWTTMLGSHPDVSWWSGRTITLVGFVARQPGLPRRGFIVGRYLVTCCVVDATLLGFPVQLQRGSIPAEGAWVQISGVVRSSFWTDPSGQQYPLIQHARVSPVSIPSSPYLSP